MNKKRVISCFLLTIVLFMNFCQVINAISYFTEDENMLLNKSFEVISEDQCEEEFEINLEVNAKEIVQSLKPKVDFELLIDASGSLYYEGNYVKSALNKLISDLVEKTDANMGAVTFQGRNNINVMQKMKHMDNSSDLTSKISRIQFGGATPMLKGLYVSHSELKSGVRDESNGKVLIIFGDGQPNVGLNGEDIYSIGYSTDVPEKITGRQYSESKQQEYGIEASPIITENQHNIDIINKANEIKNEGYEIITVFLETSDNQDVNKKAFDLFKKIASNNQAYYAEDIDKLLDIFENITESFNVNSYDVIENVSKEFVVIPESIKASSNNVEIIHQNDTINWKVDNADESTITFTYNVRRNKETPEGTYNVADSSYVKYIDKNNQGRRLDFPPVEITFEGSCVLGQIIVRYIDEQGIELAPRTFMDNLELKEYIVKAKDIEGYTLKNEPEETLTLTLENRKIVHDFIYMKEKLPQTGEKNMISYYVLALGMLAIGIVIRKK